MSQLLQMRGINKSFGKNHVLKDVDFGLSAGRIQGLIGENGAGKSTLMNILGGVVWPDSGEVLLDGHPIRVRSPREAIDCGIAFIHQELNLINDLCVYENLFIGKELRTRSGLTDRGAMRQRTREILAQMGIALDPDSLVSKLSPSYKQIVEIAHALNANARLIIMDEPTTALTQIEITLVFDLMRRLASQGVGIIFISHKLKEVLEICDDYAVLRDGRMVLCGQTAEATTDALARAMVGHAVRTDQIQPDSVKDAVALEVKNLCKKGLYEDVSFQVKAGEIVGFTGLLGDGRSDLFRSIFGVNPADAGDIVLAGQNLNKISPALAKRLGMAYVPSNRKENGIIKDLSILENGTLVTLSRFVRRGFIRQKDQLAAFDKQRQALNIRMAKPQDMITSLSGGNQQKVVLSKWLDAEPRIIVFDNPTQGVDVGAKEEIYDIIVALARQDVAIVILTSEMAEITRLCHRAFVMYHGRIAGELHQHEMDDYRIMLLQTGGQAS